MGTPYSGPFPYTNTFGHATSGIEVSDTSFSGSVVNAGTITTSGIAVSGSSISGDVENEGTLTGGITISSSTVAGVINQNVLSGNISISNSTVTADGVSNDDALTGAIAISNSTIDGVVYNQGTISDGITVSGSAVTGSSGYGVENFGAVTSGISISGSTITGSIYNDGTITGGITVSSNASITGGIYSGGTLSGGISLDSATVGGIAASGDFSGGITIDTASKVTRSFAAVHVQASTFTGGISNAGTISAKTTGVWIFQVTDFTGGITNSGTISAAGGAAITIQNDQTISGGLTNSGSMVGGVHFENDQTFAGSIVNTSNATITASGRGIALSSVAQFGIDSAGGGIVNSGTVNGSVTAISVRGGATFLGGITNSGTITDGTHGGGGVIVSGVSSFVGDISNSGSIELPNGYGIYVSAVPSFLGSIVNADAISAFAGGIRVGSSNTSGGVSVFTGGVTNSGAITGGALVTYTSGSYYDYYGQGIRVQNVQDFKGGVVNTSTGSMSGDVTGIAVSDSSGSGTFSGGISNSGSITASAYGIKVESYATFQGGIVNESGATISAGGDGIIVEGGITSFDGGITNSGTITGSGAGIALGGVSTFSGDVSNSGTISVSHPSGVFAIGNPTGIAVDDIGDFAGDIANSGSITANIGISVGTNVNFTGTHADGDVVNSGTGTITAAATGILVSSGRTTNAAFGTNTPGGLAIVNAGTISVTGAVSPFGPDIPGRGIAVRAGSVAFTTRTTSGGTSSGNAGISVFDGSITNSGTIKAAGTGVFVGYTGSRPGSAAISTFDGGITNSGAISAGNGIVLNDIATFSGDIVNGANGQITAKSGDGIEVGQSAVGRGFTYTPGTGPNPSTSGTFSSYTFQFTKPVATFLGSIVNHGTISAAAGVGIKLSSVSQFSGTDPRGDIVNTGTISGSIGIELVNTPNVSVFDSGVITGTGGAAIEFDAGVTSDNTLTLAGGYTISGDVVGGGTDTLQLGGSSSADFDFDNIGTGQQYSGFTKFDVTGGTWDTTGSGSNWVVEGGTLEVGGSVADTTVDSGGRLDILSSGTAASTTISGGTMEVASGASAGASITFTGTGGTLQIDASNTGNLLSGTTISGFVPNDTIDLASIPNQTGSLAVMNDLTDVLTVTEGTQTYTLDFSGNFVGDLFQTSSDNGGAGPGTDIAEVSATPCYCPGTLIRTPCGETRVEELKIGDQVMTAAGVARPIKWIGRRSYGGRFVMGRKDILPVCIKAAALGDNVPKRDLWISPNHAMYFEDKHLGGVLIEARDLINGASVVQAESVGSVEYVHIELETHDVIIAEGALAESFIDDDSRFLFHNACEYRALYPDAANEVGRYCAPRVQEGYQVEAVRRRLAARAGLASVGEETRAGKLRGYVDRITEECVAGWAQNADHPEAPVCLDIFAGGVLVGQVLANRYREDLERAGTGSGRHSFAFALPPGLDVVPGEVDVRRALDGVALELTAGAWRMLRQSTARHRAA